MKSSGFQQYSLSGRHFGPVYQVPANQVAGPLHINQTMEGWLGDFLSREGEADQSPDQDAPRNHILRNSVNGNVGDVADILFVGGGGYLYCSNLGRI